MKVKVIKSFGGMHGTFNEGDEVDVADHIAATYIPFGYMRAVVEEKPVVLVVEEAPKVVKVKRAEPVVLEKK